MKMFSETSKDVINPMKVGDKAYIIESNCTIREAEIKRCSGGLFLVRFAASGVGIQVRRNRLFATHEEAEQSLPKPSPAKKPIRNPYDYWY